MSDRRRGRRYPFRLGSTSYVYPADILPNVERLAPLVDDIELVLFELDDGPSNLPDALTLRRLQTLAEEHELSYTVHLPLDLRLAAHESERNISLEKARRVIECTRELPPYAYVVHLDGTELKEPHPDTDAWCAQALRSLARVGEWAGGLERIAVENLETYDPRWVERVVGQTTASFCVDIGHLWKGGHDPLPYLRRHLNRTRVIHLHGLGERDHQALTHMPLDAVRSLLDFLWEQDYQGVLTLEVFSPEDFFSSLAVVQKSLDRDSVF